MADLRLNGQQNNKIELKLPITGLSHSSSGLVISTRCDNETAPVAYTQASGNIETVSTLGLYAAPTAGKCGFREVAGSGHEYHYELQFLNTRFNVANATYVTIRISGGGLFDEGVSYQIQLGAPVITDNVTEISDAVHNGTVLNGTVNAAATSTSIPIKTLDITGGMPTANDQLKGRVILFDKDTLTAQLRGQGAPIDASTTTHITLAVADALTTAPAEDDVFRIV